MVTSQEVLIYGRDGVVEILKVERADKTSFRIMKFDYRLRLFHEKLIPTLRICIPKGGKFGSPITRRWTEESEGGCKIVDIPLKHLYAHATMRGTRAAQAAAGWPAQAPEEPETGFGSDDEMDVDDD